ncbi:hypothetical protein FHR20_002921 [Sphingomonas leidyi]|jgi:hypothetical protein|uniref:Uncharacterized protein n=1 Tax=Sphingomonas leidyi TaxID=68569 RepID=A0A7X5V130_9SPHN|nr:hypothetical protein [Sphingomonas leidyi]
MRKAALEDVISSLNHKAVSLHSERELALDD